MYAPPGGLEPPTFRLTAERASQLRHGGWLNWLKQGHIGHGGLGHRRDAFLPVSVDMYGYMKQACIRNSPLWSSG